jgi:DNA-binding NtrC family response regulator
MHSVLIVSEIDEDIRQIRSALKEGCRVYTAAGEADFKSLHERHPDVIFVDVELIDRFGEDGDKPDPMGVIRRHFPSVDIVVVSSPSRMRETIQLLKAGAWDYIIRPVHTEEVQLVVESMEKAAIRNLELGYLRDQFWRPDMLDMVHTENPAMRAVYQKIRSVAQTRATVLLIGETGTGKGVMARLIHRHSHRRDAQFISVHCGAIPDTLLESELFGHEKGAFTGAHRKKRGKFEMARGGTIFLDEIGTITPSSQIKLLQVLQDGTFSPVGGEDFIQTDARIITATNADLKKMSEVGAFRKDLYYRLNVFPIELPALRERLEDLPFLMNMFLKNLNREYGKGINDIQPSVIAALRKYSWPGNIRELENLLERAYLLENGPSLSPASFPDELFEKDNPGAVFSIDDRAHLAEARRQAIEAFERRYLKELLNRNRGKVKKSAEEAGITPRQLNKLMVKYGIHKEEYKA